MPIKCAGAPQKARYLPADHWWCGAVRGAIDIPFCLAGPVLFGVADDGPALMASIVAYGISLPFGQTLMSVDGPARMATFSQANADGSKALVVKAFDLLQVVPPQKAPDFIRLSALADAAGGVDGDAGTLRHKRFANGFALGDARNSGNAKTVAARKQAPVVGHNVSAARGQVTGEANCDGQGSWPLTVERGTVVLAEFVYGGKLAPSLPKWLTDRTRPVRAAWILKPNVLPPPYGPRCSRDGTGWRGLSAPSVDSGAPPNRPWPPVPGGR